MAAQLLHLPAGYISREVPDYFADVERGLGIWQPDAYTMAGRLAACLGANALVDLGCGRAAKLLRLRDVAPLVGVDHGENIESCRREHPEQRWVEADFERSLDHLLPLIPDGAVIVSGDVIEHLVDPLPLLQLLRALKDRASAIVLSTPDRVRTHGTDHNGPPPNPAHIREWSHTEFGALLEDFGVQPTVVGHCRSSTVRPELATIVAVCLGSAATNRPLAEGAGLDVQLPTAGWQMVSPIFDSVDDHLRLAARLGASRIELTDLAVLQAVAGERVLADDGRQAGPLPLVALTDEGRGGGGRLCPFNLVGWRDGHSPQEACELARANVFVALTGTDASSMTWPVSTVAGLRSALADMQEELARHRAAVEELRDWTNQLTEAKTWLDGKATELEAARAWHEQQAEYWRGVAYQRLTEAPSGSDGGTPPSNRS